MKERVRISKDYLKYASFLKPKEECYYNVNKSDFVSTNSDSEKVPLIDKFTTQIVYKPGKCIFWFKIFQFALIFILLFFTTPPSFGQTVINQWDFESLSNSQVSNPAPSIGTGAASIVGSMSTSGTGTVQGFGNCNSSSNSGTIGWQISNATPGSTSESSGVQFMISTSGFCNIKFSFDHRLSNASTRTRRIQYTTDGTNWINFNVNSTNYLSNCPNQGGIDDGRIDASNPMGNNAGDRWTRVTSIDFSAIPNVNNNPNFGIRIVAAHYSTSGQFRQTNSVGTIATGGSWRFDNVTLSGSCLTPTQLTFTTQPSNVNQNTSMSPAVQVAATCSDGTIATGYSGSVTLTVNSPGCGYTPQTVTFVNGVATFSNIVFLRSPQTNLIFTASSTGLTSATSNSFNVNAPLGAPTVTTIRQNNFDADQDWIYSVGADVNYGGTGSSSTPAIQGVGVIGVYNYSGNNVLRKSYSVDNASGEFGCSNTITFNNQTSLSSYNIVDFSFNLLSFGIGACGTTDGCGVESSEEFVMQVSTNGGTTWNTILTKKGFNNCLFGITNSPVTSLSIGSSRVYTTGSCDTKSAFTLSMSGISQFQFRFTANNNRTEENWAIDNIKLTGTTYGVGAPFNLPTVNLGSDLNFCSGNSQELSATVSSFQPDLSYSWSPSTGLSASNISNPVVSGLSVAQTYTLTVTDGHGCIASDQVVVTPQFVKLSPIAFD